MQPRGGRTEATVRGVEVMSAGDGAVVLCYIAGGATAGEGSASCNQGCRPAA